MVRMGYCASLLVRILRDPLQVRGLLPLQWDCLIRQARHANLLGRLYHFMDTAGVLDEVPAAPRNHLISGHYLAQRQVFSVCHEVDALRAALQAEDIPLILLKGAAYSAAGLPAGAGRVFADMDILVPHDVLDVAEAALMKSGWATTSLSAYDQQYYRRWMHELPPMQHLVRGVVLDVHHTILPPTARYHPDPVRLVADRVPVAGFEAVYTLSPVDMVLHAATHLFHEGESDNALRDISDLDILLRYFSSCSGDAFWDNLVKRAVAQQLMYPLWLALHFSVRVFLTPVPGGVQSDLVKYAPTGRMRYWLEWMYDEIFQPQHVTVETKYTALARRVLYIRGHWLRMPARLLVMHLLRKAVLPEKPPARPE